MGTGGRGLKWAIEMTAIAVGLKDFTMGGVRERVSQVCVIPAHEHFNAVKGQEIRSVVPTKPGN